MSQLANQKIEFPDEQSEDAVLASRWSRLWAVLIDIVILVPLLVMAIIFMPDSFVSDLDTDYSGDLLSALLGNVLFLLLQGYLLLKRGQTIGKYVMNIAIVSVSTNKKPDFFPLYIKRYLVLGLVSSIPFLEFIAIADGLFIFRKDKRCLHDIIAGTKVIDVTKSADEFYPGQY